MVISPAVIESEEVIRQAVPARRPWCAQTRWKAASQDLHPGPVRRLVVAGGGLL
jgi:hypothetical protein